MNLFRSEEHVRNWTLYDPAAREGTLPLRDWVRVFGVDYCRKRLEPDYFLKAWDLRPGLFQALAQLGKAGPFWGTSPASPGPQDTVAQRVREDETAR